MHLKVAYRNDTKNYRWVEILRSVRGADGKSTKVVIKRLGSAPLGDRLEGLKMLGRYQIAKLKEKEQPSFFPIDTYADKIAQARSAPQSDRPISEAQLLEEVLHVEASVIIDKNNNNQMVMPGLSNSSQANIYIIRPKATDQDCAS